MRTLFLDCTFGVSGDMLISSLLGHLDDFSLFTKQLEKIECYKDCDRVVIKDVNRYSLKGKMFEIICKKDLQLRRLDDIIKIIKSGNLKKKVEEQAVEAVCRLGAAESQVHGVSIDKVHFHEVGAVDTIFDVVGYFILLDLLNIDRVVNTKINVGSGTVDTQHGLLSVPVPAVCTLLEEQTVFSFDEQGERTTPTGAVLVSSTSSFVSGIPSGKIIYTAYGFGEKEYKDGNYLKSIIIEEDTAFNDVVWLLECNIDDMTAEHLGYACNILMENGAKDVWQQPIYMKKNRLGTKLSVLCNDKSKFLQLIFDHTSTNGIRISRVCRRVRGESTFTVNNGIKIKTTGNLSKAEFDDCANEAHRQNVPIRNIYQKLEEDNER